MDDVLKKLLQLEQEAAKLVQEAEAEAFHRINMTKTDSYASYNELLKQKRVELEAQFKEKQANLVKEREEKNLAYEQDLKKIRLFKEDFYKNLWDWIKKL
jgi:hypothetical protein